jgi:hypothetical protein
MDLMRQLVGTEPLTQEGRIAIPRQVRVGKPRRGSMPHILGWSVGPWIISERVREIMEDLEPGNQEFMPVDLISEKHREYIASYFLILPPPSIDAVIRQESEFTSADTLRRDGRCVLRAEVIRGHHFWRGQRPMHLTYFCSDKLGDRIMAEKLDGWCFDHRCLASS